jgi:hypothetical protein
MLTQHLGSPDAEAWANYLRGNIVLKITFGFRIILRDGTSIRGIDHDSPKTLNIGDGAGSTLFPMNNGFAVRSSLERSISMEPDIMDLSGFINDSIGVMKDDLRLGKYRDSDLYIFMFRWDDLTFPVIPITRGRIGDVEFEEDFVLDFRSLTDFYAQNIVQTQTIDCPFEFMGQGDAGPTTERYCGLPSSAQEWLPNTAYTNDKGRDGTRRSVVRAHGSGSPTGSPDQSEFWFEVAEDGGGTSGATEPGWNTSAIGALTTDGSVTWRMVPARVVPVTVTAATTPTTTQFSIDYNGPGPEEMFFDGRVEFTSGRLSSCIEQIESFVISSGLITLSLPFEFAPTIGDSLNLIAGCNKTMKGGFEGSPDGVAANCDFYRNNVRFGGEHHKPGNLKLLRAVRPS